MQNVVRPTLAIATLATVALSALVLTQPAFANGPDSDGGSAASAYSKYKSGSKQWKQCMGQAHLDMEDAYALGYWMAKTGEYEEALKVLASIGDQNDPRVLTMMGFVQRHLGHLDEAFGYYEKALAANPDMTSTRQYLGEAFLQTGEPTKAKAQLAQIAQRCGTACEDYQQLASAIAAYKGKS
jgi:tetratricopeptide (TPR) repeat protein